MPEQISENTVTGEIIHHWTIQEYEQHERGSRWYVIMGVFGSILTIYGLFTGNFLFSLVIILFAIILYLQSHQEPPQVLFRITDLGIVVGSRFYSYSELDAFYIIYQPPEVKSLYFEPKKVYRPRIQVPLLDADPVEIRETLLQFLPEDLEKEEEPVSEQISRHWKIH